MEPMGFEPTTSCMPYMISVRKCLLFMLLHAFVKRQYRFHTGGIPATYCGLTENTNKADARMTP